MRRLCVGVLVAACLLIPPAKAADPLEISIFPYLSAKRLVELYSPLLTHLEESLDRAVVLTSAADYRAYIGRVRSAGPPVLVAASHMAPLFAERDGYRAVLRPEADMHAVLLVAADGPVRRLADLRGGFVATPDPLAQITMITRALLAANGLQPGADVTVGPSASHSNALRALNLGRADAAAVSARAFDQMKPGLKDSVRVLATSERMETPLPGVAPPVVFMVAPDFRAGERFARLVARFANDTPEGRAFIARFGYRGLRPMREDEMQRLRAYLPRLRALLAEAPG